MDNQSLGDRINAQIGDLPIGDSLAAISWTQRALAVASAPARRRGRNFGQRYLTVA